MYAIKDGRVLTAAGVSFAKATVLFDEGKILAVGENLPIPDDATVIDASGCWVTPGLIEAHSHIAVKCEPGVRGGTPDNNEVAQEPTTPQVRALDAFHPFDPGIESARKAGFTTCCVLPGSANVIGGIGFSFKTQPKATADEMMIPGTEVMKFALGENPRFNYGSKGKMPKTRMGVAACIRQMLFDAKNYSERLQNAEETNTLSSFKRDFKLEALVPAVRGEMVCRFHCHRADDIATVLRIAEEFNLKLVLDHATEGYKISSQIAARNVPCVVGPTVSGPYKQELWGRSLETPARLVLAGVEVALCEDAGVLTKMLPVHVGLCIKNGLSHEQALQCVTRNAAHILGLDDRLGTLECGKDADLAIFDGDPFCNYTNCLYTIVNGTVFKNI